MERSREPADTVVTVEATEVNSDFGFNQEENDVLNDVLANLSAKQFRAARLDAAGIDATTTASLVKVVPQSITRWRNDEYYSKAKALFISIINRQGIKFRLDCQRQIITPVYAELIRRVNNPKMLMGLDHKALLDTVKVVGKESRLDALQGGAVEDDDELQELQRRRVAFSHAKQAQQIAELENQDKIIQFPLVRTGTDNGAM